MNATGIEIIAQIDLQNGEIDPADLADYLLFLHRYNRAAYRTTNADDSAIRYALTPLGETYFDKMAGQHA